MLLVFHLQTQLLVAHLPHRLILYILKGVTYENWDRILVGRGFPPVQTGPGAHQASCTMGTGSFPG